MPLKVSDGIGAWIKDFQKSDAPQFKNSSREERRDQAIAAYLSAKGESVEENVGAPRTAAHRRAMMVGVNRAKEKQKNEPPFTPDPPKPAAKNSDQTKQSPMSRAKQLAKKARDAQPVDEILHRKAMDQIRKGPKGPMTPPKKDPNSPEAQAAKRREDRMKARGRGPGFDESTNLDEKVEYAEYQFKNRKHAEKAHEYLKSVQRQGLNVEDDSIHRGQLRVDADDKEKNKDISQHHNHIMKNFPGVKATHIESYKVNENNKVKLKGFGPDNAKGNMGNPSARAALNPMRKRAQDNEKARQALKDPDHNPAWASSKTPKPMMASRDPSKSGGSGYDLYHKDFSSAMKHAYGHAKNKLGVDIDPKEIDDKVASGPRKPSKGKTNRYRLMGKDGKKAVQIQVHGMDSGKYELNMYKESVELDENKNLIKDYEGMKAQGKKDSNILDLLMSMPKYKRMSRDQMAKIIGDAKRKGIFRKEEVELDETSSTRAKWAMKKGIERQAASYTTSGAYDRRAKIARNKRDALLKKADALPDHHKPRSSGGDYFKGSSEHEKLTKKAQDHNMDAHYYSNKSKEAEKRGDKQGVKIGRSQDRAYPKLGKALKANPDNRRANRIADTQVTKMRDKHFATTTQARGGYDYKDPRKETRPGKQHSQYPKKTDEAVLVNRDYKVKDGKVHISRANFSKVHKDYKNATKGKERMTVLDPKSQATVSAPVVFNEAKDMYKSAAQELKTYADKSGGMDKKDFHAAAKNIESIGRANVLQKGQLLAKFSKQLRDLDTSPREKILSVLDKHGHQVGDFMPGVKMKKSFRTEDVQEGSLARLKMIRKAGEKYNKEKKAAERKAERDAKRGIKQDPDLVEPQQEGAGDEGAKAARSGKSYSSNPYPKGSSDHLAWSKAHNKARARQLNMGEEFTMKQYRKNEDENRHSENALELAKKFGTKKEIETVQGIHDRHMKRGHITEPDRSTRDRIARKHYPKLTK